MTELHAFPPVAAEERITLEQFLDYFRSVLLRKADGIDDAQARLRVGVSTIDLLGLIRHMALVEQWWFSQAFAGSTEADLWTDPDAGDPDTIDPDSDWHHAPDDTLAAAIEALNSEITKARAIVAAATSLNDTTAIDVGPRDDPERYGRRSLRWILIHMIEEYARHCGHADLLREAIDGSVGD